MLVNGGLIAFLFPRTKFQIENKSTLSEKLKAYRTWVIIRAALLEAVALFCGVGIPHRQTNAARHWNRIHRVPDLFYSQKRKSGEK